MTETPTKKPTKAKKETEPTPVTVDTYEWITTEFGQFRVEETRYMWKSVSKDGEDLIFGMTKEAVIQITPMHLESKSPDYDGKYHSNAQYSASAGVKL